MSRFIAVTDSESFRAVLAEAVDSTRPGALRLSGSDALATSPASLVADDPADPVDVLVLGPDLPLPEALAFSMIADAQLPGVCIVLAGRPDASISIQAMRSGVRDILDPDADVASVRVLLERASLTAAAKRRDLQPEHSAEQRTGRIISVASPKGGVGKTTIATNLAAALARSAPMSVVLVDLDAQFGDVASALGLHPEHSIVDAVSGPARQDAMVMKTYLSIHPGSFYALCAPVQPADADFVSGEAVTTLLQQLAQEFRYVVVDTAPGLGEHALAALECSSDVLLVCSMDVPSVRGLRKELDVLDTLKLARFSRHVAVNFAEKSVGLSIRDIEATIGMSVKSAIPRAKEIALATNVGQPLLLSPPRTRPAKILGELAEVFQDGVRPRRGAHRKLVVG